MDKAFGKLLKKLRTETRLSQQQLADMVFVNRCSIANWESGRRVPDLVVLSRIAGALNVDISVFTNTLDYIQNLPDIVILDEEKKLLSKAIALLEKSIPNANITGFTNTDEAIKYARNNKIAIAFLETEIGEDNGLDLCKLLLDINPLTNVIFLTSNTDYALKAWDTGASGFIEKPLKSEEIFKQLFKLRHPIPGLI